MNLWSIALELGKFTLTVCLSIAAVFVAMNRWIGPMLAAQIGEELKDEFAIAERTTKAAMSSLGEKGAQMREVAEIEGLVSEAVLDQYPELQMLLESVNPDLYDRIMEKLRENPELIHILYERWGHLLARRGDPRRGEERNGPKYPRL